MMVLISIYQKGKDGKNDYKGGGGQAGLNLLPKGMLAFFPRSGSVLPDNVTSPTDHRM